MMGRYLICPPGCVWPPRRYNVQDRRLYRPLAIRCHLRKRYGQTSFWHAFDLGAFGVGVRRLTLLTAEPYTGDSRHTLTS